MRVTLNVLADYANLSVEGKLNIMGVFTQIVAMSVPSMHPRMQLVLRFESEPAERGMSKTVQIKLLDADGNQLAGVAQALSIPENAPLRAQFPVLLALNGLTLPKYGQYTFHVLVNEDTKAEVPFEVIPPPAQLRVPTPPTP
jgi:hypothetical protein